MLTLTEMIDRLTVWAYEFIQYMLHNKTPPKPNCVEFIMCWNPESRLIFWPFVNKLIMSVCLWNIFGPTVYTILTPINFNILKFAPWGDFYSHKYRKMLNLPTGACLPQVILTKLNMFILIQFCSIHFRKNNVKYVTRTYSNGVFLNISIK